MRLLWALLLIICTLVCQSADDGSMDLRIFHAMKVHTRFSSLSGVLVTPAREAVFLTEPCSGRLDDCDFSLHHIPTFVNLFRHQPCSGQGGVSFSLDPADPADPWGEHFKKVYRPLACSSMLQDSLAGEILFAADWDLKQLLNNTNGIGDSVPGYQPLNAPLGDSSGELMSRFWITVSKIDVLRSASVMLFRRAHLQVHASLVIRNASSASGLSDFGELPAALQTFIDHINANMDMFTAKLRSFRQLQQLSLAQEAVRFAMDEQADFPDGYLQALEYVPNTVSIVPAIIHQHTVQRIMRFYGESAAWDAQTTLVLGLLDQQLLSNDASINNTMRAISADKSLSIACTSDNSSWAQGTNFSLTCLAERDPSAGGGFTFSDPLPGQAKDPCLPGVLNIWDAAEGRFVSLVSSFLDIPGQRSFYNISGPAVAVAWICSADSVLFTPPLFYLESHVVVIKFELSNQPADPADPCRLDALLAQVQAAGAAGVVLIHADDVPPVVSYILRGAASISVSMPVRIISQSDAMEWEEQLEDYLLIGMACNVPIRPDPIVEHVVTNITFGDAIYTTLDQANVLGAKAECQVEFFLMPDGYELVPPSQAIIDHIVAAFPWSNKHLMLADYGLYATTLSTQQLPGTLVEKVALEVSNSSMRPARCGKILIRSIPTWVAHAGYFYRTLDGTKVSDSRKGGQEAALPLPAGWELAPASADVLRNVVSMYPWGTPALLLRNGKCYFTKMESATAGVLCNERYLLKEEQGLYAGYRNARVLIRQAIHAAASKELGMGWKRRTRQSIQLKRSVLGAMTIRDGNGSHLADRICEVTITTTTHMLTHGGVDMSNVQLSAEALPLQAEQAMLSRSWWLGFTDFVDPVTGTRYQAHRAYDKLFVDVLSPVSKSAGDSWQSMKSFWNSAAGRSGSASHQSLLETTSFEEREPLMLADPMQLAALVAGKEETQLTMVVPKMIPPMLLDARVDLNSYRNDVVASIAVLHRQRSALPVDRGLSHSGLLVTITRGDKFMVEFVDTTGGQLRVIVVSELIPDHSMWKLRTGYEVLDEHVWQLHELGAIAGTVTLGHLQKLMELAVSSRGEYSPLFNNCHMAQEDVRRMLGFHVDKPYKFL